MRKILILTLFVSTSVFANTSLDQFDGDYSLIKCEGNLGDYKGSNMDKATITSGEDWVKVSIPQSEDFSYNTHILNINKKAIKEREENDWACINSSRKSIFEGNVVAEITNFTSYPFCKGIPAIFGKIIFQIKNLGNGKISIFNKHTMFENYVCYYQRTK